MLKKQLNDQWQFLSDVDLVCFSHLRWNFVYQRPQHLLNRFAKHTRVFFIEEPIFDDAPEKLHINESDKNVWVVVPHLERGLTGVQIVERQTQMVNSLFSIMGITKYFFWYYTPMALTFSRHLKPITTVYDCMDELAAFKFAPVELKNCEKELLQKADVVFTGGHSIYEAKKNSHNNIFPFPSSIDKEHFATARTNKVDPADQKEIAHPRFGFFGVIDERLDISLIAEVAEAKPEWQFIIIGPVVKIDPATLPQLTNLHYLGGKNYNELPQYLSGWDVAMIPFAMNESTKFISPTKTPEYLAAGKPVISTPIQDVISPYADNKLVHIATDAKQFIECGTKILKGKQKAKWLAEVDAFLAGNSWDRTWIHMVKHIETAISAASLKTKQKEKLYV